MSTSDGRIRVSGWQAMACLALLLEWFGHYLKGELAARWITEGETWVEREERIGG